MDIKQLWRDKAIQKLLIIPIILTVILEVFVFNFRFFESLGYSEIKDIEWTYSEGVIVNNDGTITTPDKTFYIESDTIGEVTKNLLLNTTHLKRNVNIQLSATDDGNKYYYTFPEHTNLKRHPQTHYIKLNLSGNTNTIRIEFKNLRNRTIKLNTPQINVETPFFFSKQRALLVFCLLFVFSFLRPKSKIYNTELNWKDRLQKVTVILAIVAQISVLFLISRSNPNFANMKKKQQWQYHELAVAITKGQFHLEVEPSEELKSLENPYDSKLRDEKDIDYIWDVAYRDGKYYVYFGIGPVLVSYLPYYLITGKAFPTHLGVVFSTILFLLGLFFLLKRLINQFYPKISFGMFLLLESLLFFSAGSIILVTHPSFYAYPIALGLACTVWGLNCWLSSVKGGKINRKLLTLGAFFMAFVAACRPQLLLGSFFVFPIFLPVIKDRLKIEKNKKSILIDAFYLAIPYMIVALLLMYYNYVRFGSILDFGASYNLTTNDMTHRGIKLDRTPLGIFTYLFQFPNFSVEFPYIRPTQVYTEFQGRTINERLFGGWLMFNPILWFSVLFIKVKGFLEKHKLKWFVLLSFLFTLIIIFADTQMAGILFRYNADFALFISLAAFIIILGVLQKDSITTPIRKHLNTVFYSIFVYTTMINVFFSLYYHYFMTHKTF